MDNQYSLWFLFSFLLLLISIIFGIFDFAELACEKGVRVSIRYAINSAEHPDITPALFSCSQLRSRIKAANDQENLEKEARENIRYRTSFAKHCNFDSGPFPFHQIEECLLTHASLRRPCFDRLSMRRHPSLNLFPQAEPVEALSQRNTSFN
jgi:hypothetical protein